MPTEQRIISSKPKINASRPPGAVAPERGAEPAEATGKKKRRRPGKKVLLIALVAILVLGGAAYWFLLKPKAEPVAEVAPTPVAGEVVTVEAVSLNLAGGHYLRIGLGLQLTAEVTEPPDTARALDLAIALFSGRTVEEVSSPEAREALKAQLGLQLVEAYEGEVMAVYFTDYVTQ